jgi:O-acetyl-ADP-ribose deacetylase (regulator of RNase III)
MSKNTSASVVMPERKFPEKTGYGILTGKSAANGFSGEHMRKTFGTGILELLQGDLTEQVVDAVVNAANTHLAGGGGVDGAIHRRGGSAIMEECRKIGGCPTGQTVMTTGGNLPARFVLHTVGPVWRGGRNGEAELLTSCYRSALTLARDHSLASVAFASISTGVYG